MLASCVRRSSNFYLFLLLTMLFLCTLPVGYVIGRQQPSNVCGPFSGRQRFYSVVSEWIDTTLPAPILKVLAVIRSPGIVLPAIVLLT